MRTLALLAIPLLASACLQSRAMVRLPEKTDVLVAYVLDDSREREVKDVPEALKKRIAARLAERNLEVREVPFDQISASFRNARATQIRLERMASLGGSEPLLLLVETSAVYFSHIEGRFRWIVDARLTAARREKIEAPMSSDVEASTIVDFIHEREKEALAAAAPTIAERTGSLFDSFLAAELDAPGPADAPKNDSAPVSGPQPLGRSDDAEVIYFVMVDRFANGDPSNDGEIDPTDPAGFHGGDLQGVIDHLDELQSLGVTSLWLSPVFRMRTEKFFEHGAFHGYWVEDFGAVEPRFGDRRLLQRLAEELQRRGMRLYLDVVLNHVAMDGELLREKPHWFHRCGPLLDWNDEVELTTHDVHGLPDLAVEREEVYRYLLDTSLMWIREVKPDGFRLDAVKHIPIGFWARYNDDVRRAAGDGFVLLGELLDGDPAKLARTQREGRFGRMFDFPLYFALIDVFCRDAPVSRLATALYADRLYDDPHSLVTLLDNHDLPRVMSDCGGEIDRVKQALTFQLTARGTPSLTWGTEVGLEGAKEPENRGDMRFVDHPLKEHIRDQLALRRRHPSLRQGATKILALDRELLAYARIADRDATIIAVNRSSSGRTIEIPDALRVGARVRDVDGAEIVDGPVSLPPRSVRVLVLDRADGFAQLARQADVQWRHGARRREIVLAGPADAQATLLAVGSGDELGAWDPANGIVLAGETRLQLPVGGVFELKLVRRRPDGGFDWAPDENRLLFVEEGDGPLRVELHWPDQR